MGRDGVHNEFSGSAWFVVQARDIQGGIHIHAPDPDAPLTERAAAELARTVRAQWRDEAAARDLFNPAPLPVVWAADSAEVADHAENIGATAVGRSDDVSGLADAFRDLPHGRLVLLGEAGAGKTTLAMVLVLELLARWTPDDPVPVLLSMESWEPGRMHFRTWLAARLTADYPHLAATYGRDVASRLVRERRVLPVLDGFDEMPARARESVLPLLNKALADGDPLILASRTGEYFAAVDASDVFRHAAVLRAQPVSPGAAIAYLRASVPPRRLTRWQPVFDGITAKGPLAETLSTPLMVWLARVVYSASSASPAELTDQERFPERAAIEEHLLGGFVPAVFPGTPEPEDHPGPSTRAWPSDRAERWLRFLADHLTRARTEHLRWWQLYRSPLPRMLSALAAGLGVVGLLLVTRWLVVVFRDAEAGAEVSAMSELAFFSGAGLVLGTVNGIVSNGIARLLFSLRPGMPSGRARRPELRLMFRGARHILRLWPVRVVLAGGLVWLLLPSWSMSTLGGLGALVPILLGFGLSAAVRGVVMFPADPHASVSPERLLAGERTGLLLSCAIVGLINGGIVIAVLGAGGTPALLASAVAGGWFGSAAVMAFSSAWPRWLLARTSLAATGRLPWRLTTFLHDARRRGVLRQDAGSYEFRHVQVRRHLARVPEPAEAGALRWDGEELRIQGTALPRIRLRPLFSSSFLLAVGTVGVWLVSGTAGREMLGVDAVFVIGAGFLCGLYLLFKPYRAAELRMDGEVVEAGTSARRFRCRWDDIAEVTVLPTLARSGWRTGYYAIHVRLRAGVAPPERVRPRPDGWIPLWTLGRSPRIPSAVAAALIRLSGDRWVSPDEQHSV
ncbi:NACHT domain-containing protein [Amycolatopsis pigmentata]|uniref:NACHT domain-containing protein n=1 Tax=Amycolatopsis pigmentata TaxID=450801 RepID=A0ABW5FMJ1_9PSEU